MTSTPTDDARRERYAAAIHDAMESDLSLVDQEPGAQALFARAAEAAEAVADAELRAVLDGVRAIVRRLANHAVGFQDVLDESDRGPWGALVGADITALQAALGAVPLAAAPAVDRTTLRTLITEALLTTPRADYDTATDHREHRYDARCALCAAEADTLANAVLAVLPTSRAAAFPSVRPHTLTSIACHLDARAVAIMRPGCQTFAEWQTVIAELRRTAGEQQQPEAPRRGDQVEQWLKAQRDEWAPEASSGWRILDGVLGLYRRHADTGTPLSEHVCEEPRP